MPQSPSARPPEVEKQVLPVRPKRRWPLWQSLLLLLLTAGLVAAIWCPAERRRAETTRQANACNNAARLEATRVRWFNPEGALKLATRACELTDWENPGYLDTLAVAYAAAGDFEAARKWQQRAIELQWNETLASEYHERLALYEAKKPYRVQEWDDAMVEAMRENWKSGKK